MATVVVNKPKASVDTTSDNKLLQEYLDAVEALAAIEPTYKAAKKSLDGLKDRLLERIPADGTVAVGKKLIAHVVTTQNRISTELVLREFPDAYSRWPQRVEIHKLNILDKP